MTKWIVRIGWSQFVWGVAMLLTVLTFWGRMEARLTRLEEQLKAKATAVEVAELRVRLDTHIVGTAQAATR